MTPRLSPVERAMREAQQLAAAEAEAAALRKIVRLREIEGLTYAEAMERTGHVLPHSTLHDRLRLLEEKGVMGLVDGRHPPPSSVTPEVHGFIVGVGRANRVLPVVQILDLVLAEFKVELKPRTVQDVLHRAGLARPSSSRGGPPSSDASPGHGNLEGGVTGCGAEAGADCEGEPYCSPEPDAAAGDAAGDHPEPPSDRHDHAAPALPRALPTTRSEVPEDATQEILGAGAGLAWLAVGDDLVGYTKGLAGAVREVTKDFPPPGPVTSEERSLRDEGGRFLPDYNAPRERHDPEIGAVFASVETKREDKDLGPIPMN